MTPRWGRILDQMREGLRRDLVAMEKGLPTPLPLGALVAKRIEEVEQVEATARRTRGLHREKNLSVWSVGA